MHQWVDSQKPSNKQACLHKVSLHATRAAMLCCALPHMSGQGVSHIRCTQAIQQSIRFITEGAPRNCYGVSLSSPCQACCNAQSRLSMHVFTLTDNLAKSVGQHTAAAEAGSWECDEHWYTTTVPLDIKVPLLLRYFGSHISPDSTVMADDPDI